ncbi:M23 family metallopeptidase [Polynucleobacter sp. Ross1-W9]|uniref:M23 family metallopeptidase n=1 Tax=Polynucleobacter parvulilacunae TaxID=1855631 RepID=UPI001C0E571C|nr:M23 family metallopeptidase [Polynucleobacter parvulilacunae]MBU3556868.1 M23 family metallopeptidase [Polynucleobacter parvulilacunae]
MTGPHSKVREISLTARHLVFGGALSLALLVGANVAINDVTNETKDILHAMEKKELLEKRFMANSEDDYETKLMELQARLDEAQRNLAQLDDLRIQLAKTNGVNLATNTNYSNNVVDLGNAQGGPLSPANAVINLGNQGEQYGARLDRTVQDSIALSNRVQEVQKSLTQSWDVSTSIPTASPLPLMPQASSGLGYRIDPITQQTAWHEGTDFPAAYGTPILATAEGVVLRAAWDQEYGYVVDVQHKNAVVTRYAHAQEILVKQGDFVKQSQAIAKVGSTGRSTGPHLHYEVLRDGVTLGKN